MKGPMEIRSLITKRGQIYFSGLDTGIKNPSPFLLQGPAEKIFGNDYKK